MAGGTSDANSRNALWMAPDLAGKVAETELLIVGCGGTGSVVTLAAAGLGFRHLTLCDPDYLERSDLNRTSHAGVRNVGHPKVDVLHQHLDHMSPGIKVNAFKATFPDERILSKINEGHMLAVGCVDNVKVRLETDLLLRQRRVTLVDVGTGFLLDETGRAGGSGGQVLISRAGGPCLSCLGFGSTAVPGWYPLVTAPSGPEASVVTLNNVVASLALDLVLTELRGAGAENVLRYSRNVHRIERYRAVGDPRCRVCGPSAQLPGAISALSRK